MHSNDDYLFSEEYSVSVRVTKQKLILVWISTGRCRLCWVEAQPRSA